MANIKDIQSPTNNNNTLGSDAAGTNDSILIGAVNDGASDASANNNQLNGFYLNTFSDMQDGNDKFTIQAINKAEGYDANVNGNYLYGGRGNDKFTLLAKTRGDNASIYGNTIFSFGQDNETIKLTAQAKFDNADISHSEITSEDGNDKIDLKATTSSKNTDFAASWPQATVYENSIYSGDGNDKIKLTAQASKATLKQDGTGNTMIKGEAFIQNNTIRAGEDSDRIDFTAKGALGSTISNNWIDSGYNPYGNGLAKDQIKLIATAGGGKQKTDGNVINVGDAEIQNNYIELGGTYDSSSAKLTLKASSIDASASGNTITGGGNDSSILIDVKAKGGIDTIAPPALIGPKVLRGDLNFDNNSLDARADMSIKLTAKDELMVTDNTNDTYRTREFKFVGQGDTFDVSGNDFRSYENHVFSLKAKSKTETSVFDGNSVGGGTDISKINISAEDLTLTNNLFYGGDNGDTAFLKIKANSGTVEGNTLDSASYGYSSFSLDIDTGLGSDQIDDFFENNYFNFDGSGQDTLILKNKAQMIDLTDGLAETDGGLDQIILGAKSSLTLDVSNVMDLSDADDTLFIGGKKGSTVDVTGGGFSYNLIQDGYNGTSTTHLFYNDYAGTIVNLHVQAGIEVIGATSII